MKPGLKTKIALVIAIPLAIEVYFLFNLLGSLGEIKKERVAETMTMETLVAVNVLVNDTVACGHVMLFRPKDDPLYARYSLLKQHQREFRRLLHKKTAPKTANIDAFVQAVEALIGASERCNINSADDVFRFGLQNQIQDATWKITTSGEEVIRELSKLQEEQALKSNQSEAALRDTVIGFTIGAVILALLAVAYILREFGTAFNTLMRNTERVAKKEELLPPLKGAGELARLDALIDNLSAELEEARQQEKTLVENTAVLMCSISSDLIINDITPAVEKLLKFRQYEIRGESLLSFVEPGEKQQVTKTFERCRQSQESTTFECRIKTKAQKFIFSQWTIQWNERDENFFATVQDTSIRKEAEQLKAEVVAMVSHDLRSPLASLLVSFDMMDQGFAGEFNDEGKEIVGQTRGSIASLMSLINDLIDAEKFDSNSYVPHLEIVRIKGVLTDMLARDNEDAKSKQLKIELESEDLDLRADEEKIVSVIKTFLGHAIKRSPEGAMITLSCLRKGSNQKSKGMVEVRVEDFGIALKEEQCQQLFERFSTTSSAAASLRFVLCRAIIEAHDGEIGIESPTPKGATALWFRIPLQ